jgi:hypothetical protein
MRFERRFHVKPVRRVSRKAAKVHKGAKGLFKNAVSAGSPPRRTLRLKIERHSGKGATVRNATEGCTQSNAAKGGLFAARDKNGFVCCEAGRWHQRRP